MNTSSKASLLLVCTLLVLIAALVHLDRRFFKNGKSFCPRFLYSCLPHNPRWDLPSPSQEELNALEPIFDQKFYYIAKGAHCFAFLSEDKKYVIKFHRYASHFRTFPWLTHPFSYQFNERRKQIKAHNIEQLDYNLSCYKASFEHLKEESGLLLVHINKTDYLNKKITLVDHAHITHSIPLDQVTFILQRRADLLYPTLDQLYAHKDLAKAKQVVSQVIQLISSCCQKGYVDLDPVLRKNYGLLEDRAIHIDIGDIVSDEKVMRKEARLAHVKELTLCLKKRIQNNYPELLEHYEHEMRALQ